MTSSKEVEEAYEKYMDLQEQYLLERGWVVVDEKHYTWGKEGVRGWGLLDVSEAVWAERSLEEEEDTNENT